LETCVDCKLANYGDFNVKDFAIKLLQINFCFCRL
jgi:hypothetical protein